MSTTQGIERCHAEIEIAVRERANPLTYRWESWLMDWTVEELLIMKEKQNEGSEGLGESVREVGSADATEVDHRPYSNSQIGADPSGGRDDGAGDSQGAGSESQAEGEIDGNHKGSQELRRNVRQVDVEKPNPIRTTDTAPSMDQTKDSSVGPDVEGGGGSAAGESVNSKGSGYVEPSNYVEPSKIKTHPTFFRTNAIRVPQPYAQFLISKQVTAPIAGFDIALDQIHSRLLGPQFGFQGDITRWAIRRGCAAIWADTGLGKTSIQLEWSRLVCQHTGGRVLIVAPLAVGGQTSREAQDHLQLTARVVRDPLEVDTGAGISITSYDLIHKFNPRMFAGVVLDESSILKSFDGKTKKRLCEMFAATPYKLCCTATPSPNDVVELGNHAEFLGVMEQRIMLTRWFTHDSGDTSTWRLKKHATKDFWRWVASWAVSISKPSDLGYEDGAFILPPLDIQHHIVDVGDLPAGEDRHGQAMMFRGAKLSATTLHGEMRITSERRAQRVHDIVTAPVNYPWICKKCGKPQADGSARCPCGSKSYRHESAPTVDPWLIWINTNYEADAVRALLNVTEVKGPDRPQDKEAALLGFAANEIPILLTKTSIAGFGMNWQNCRNMVFMGLSYSYESLYQAIRRCWRFGQKRAVTAYIVAAESEGSVLDAIQRKERDHVTMKAEMLEAMRETQLENLYGLGSKSSAPGVAMTVPDWVRTEGA